MELEHLKVIQHLDVIRALVPASAHHLIDEVAAGLRDPFTVSQDTLDQLRAALPADAPIEHHWCLGDLDLVDLLEALLDSLCFAAAGLA